jgi:oxygen-independent coproporphyrinogen-3 oxidase
MTIHRDPSRPMSDGTTQPPADTSRSGRGAGARITPAELTRFSIEAPRYTSYPTAAEFTAAVGPGDYAHALAAAGARPDAPPLSLYVHLPFCRAICRFCGCHAMVARDPERIDRYLTALATEAATVAGALGRRLPVAELHFGGGSPSYLDGADFTRVMSALRAAFALDEATQISLEADPRTTDLDKLRTYRELGVRRLSFGFQDLADEVQEAIGRHQSADVSRAAVANARAVGFDAINVDLCYGLPAQTAESFRETVAEVAALRPERVAIFGYAHVPWMKPMQRLIPVESLPRTELRLTLMADARAALLAAGYRAIGLDHFALPDDPLARADADGTLHRNFQGYTTTSTDTLLGLGLSAISDLPAGYFQNVRALGDYDRGATAGALVTERGVLRSPDDIVRGDVIRALLCAGRVDVSAIERRFGLDFATTFAPELAELRSQEPDGLVRVEPEAIVLTELGVVFARNVARVFDAYRRRAAGAAKGPRDGQRSDDSDGRTSGAPAPTPRFSRTA